MIVLAWILITGSGVQPFAFPDYQDCMKIAANYPASKCEQTKVFVMKPSVDFPGRTSK